MDEINEEMNEEMNEILIEEFKCPVCYEYIHPPFRQCMEGHTMCTNCFHKVASCPLCRARKCPTSCKLLRDVYNNLKFPCINENCKEIFLGRRIENHFKACSYRVVKCRICPWADCAKVLTKHFYKNHMDYIGLDLKSSPRTFPFRIADQEFALDSAGIRNGIFLNVCMIHGYRHNYVFSFKVLSSDGVLIDTLTTNNSWRSFNTIDKYLSDNGSLSYSISISYPEVNGDKVTAIKLGEISLDPSKLLGK